MGCPGAREGAAGSPPFLGPPRSPLARPLGNGARRRSRAPCGEAAGRPGPAAARARRDRRSIEPPGRGHGPSHAAEARAPVLPAPVGLPPSPALQPLPACPTKVPPTAGIGKGAARRRKPFPPRPHPALRPAAPPACTAAAAIRHSPVHRTSAPARPERWAGAIARGNRRREDARIAGQGLAAHPAGP